MGSAGLTSWSSRVSARPPKAGTDDSSPASGAPDAVGALPSSVASLLIILSALVILTLTMAIALATPRRPPDVRRLDRRFGAQPAAAAQDGPVGKQQRRLPAVVEAGPHPAPPPILEAQREHAARPTPRGHLRVADQLGQPKHVGPPLAR